MIHKLPEWVEIEGFLPAFNAGYVNAIGLLGFEYQAVSHLTDISTFLSLEPNYNMQAVPHLLLVMAGFIVGAAYSGFIIGNVALRLGRNYSLALITESLLLGVSMLLLNYGSPVGQYFASAACGLQNAMTSTYRGAVVRTTHVSGLFTDLGVALGLRVRGQLADNRRIVLYLILIIGFISGGVAGAVCFGQYRFSAILVPCIVTTLLGAGYWLFTHQTYWRLK